MRSDRMPRYMVLWNAQVSAWPTDRKQVLTVLEGAVGGGDQLLKAGPMKGLGWFTPQKGYAVCESDSKAHVLGMLQAFCPYYDYDVHEMVPWEDGKRAMLESA